MRHNIATYRCPNGHLTTTKYTIVASHTVCPAISRHGICSKPLDFFVGEVPIALESRMPNSRMPYSGFLRYVFRKTQKIDEPRLHGVWTEEHGKIYISCLGCGAINNITSCAIDYDGTVECFYCSNCDMNHFIILGDWKRRRNP